MVLGWKPAPVTAIESPLFPLETLVEISGEPEEAKELFTMLVPSDADTVCTPEGVNGTTKVALNVPAGAASPRGDEVTRAGVVTTAVPS